MGMLYICSPYTHPDESVRASRVVAVAHATAALIRMGYLAYSPILHTVPMVDHCGIGATWEAWADYDHAFIDRCRLVIVLTIDGWNQSKGVAAEIQYAVGNGIPVIGVSLEGLERGDFHLGNKS
jgi:nucleoside 2-deoxyribosyltransferase